MFFTKVAFFPEDADWVLSCDTMSHTSTVLWSAASSIGQAFTDSRKRGLGSDTMAKQGSVNHWFLGEIAKPCVLIGLTPSLS